MDVRVKFAKPKKGQANYLNANAVNNVVKYIFRGANYLPEHQRLYGCEGIINTDSVESIISEMMHTKKIFGHVDGSQCRHLVIFFEGRPHLSRKQIRRKIERAVGFWKRKYQLYWGVHYAPTKEDGRMNWHIHLMLNNIDMVTGNRVKVTKKDRQEFQKQAKRIWRDVKCLETQVGSKSAEANADGALNLDFETYDCDIYDFT